MESKKELKKFLNDNKITLEEALYEGLLVVDIENTIDLKILKDFYNLKGEGYYLKVNLEEGELELAKQGYFFAEQNVPSSIFIEYLEEYRK